MFVSASDFLPDVLASLLLKLKNPSKKWAASYFLEAPKPWAKDNPYKTSLLSFLTGILYWLVQRFSYWLIITVGFGFVIMFQVADLTRLNKFYMLPNWAKRWYKDMKQNELDTFIASTPLVLSFIPFIFAPFPIFGAVALITTGADAVACIVGKKYGKHSLKTNLKKTIEGFIAGGLTTFIIVFLISLVYSPWMVVTIEKIILMSLVATLLFLLVDAYTKNISDNILNPILTGFGMWIIFLL